MPRHLAKLRHALVAAPMLIIILACTPTYSAQLDPNTSADQQEFRSDEFGRSIIRLATRTIRIAMVVAASVGTVGAQPADPQIQLDLQQFRSDGAISLDRGPALDNFFTSPTAPLGFTFSVQAPIFYNSNAENLSSGGTQTLEGNPEIWFGWSKQANSFLKVSALADTNWDRYVRSNNADQDVAYGVFRAQLVPDPGMGGSDQSYQPFISYSPRMIFDPTYSKSVSTANDLVIGIDKIFNFDDQLNRIPYENAHSSRGTSLSLGFEGTVTRRFVDSTPSLWFLSFSPSVRYYFTAPFGTKERDEVEFELGLWNAGLALKVTPKWYDEFRRFPKAGFPSQSSADTRICLPDILVPRPVQGRYAGAKTGLGSPKVGFSIGVQ